MPRKPTATSAFGVSRREAHDASAFYRRFTPPELSSDSNVDPTKILDKLIVGDSRQMDEVPDGSVALVVTSPPYFAGKEYEQALGQGGVPGSYIEYLDMLRQVLAECVRKLEPGGRIAINVANLGRRPYRSLSADVTSILQDDLCLLLRGEIIWVKQRGSSGSCAWGSFQQAGNPVLRDLTERVVVASKGRFDRALTPAQRAARGLPHLSSMTRDDFMEGTLDLWELPAESAKRVGHPAPFPVELPARLVNLYTYAGDLVLDPFLGSGSTAVAAHRLGRHYVGYDLDESYVRLAERRLADEPAPTTTMWPLPKAGPPAVAGSGASVAATASGVTASARAKERWACALAEGLSAGDLARIVLEGAGFGPLRRNVRQPGGLTVSFAAEDCSGRTWLFDVIGSHTTYRAGLKRADVVWKALAKAAVVAHAGTGPLVLMTTAMPGLAAPGGAALASLTGPGRPVEAVVDLLNPASLAQLARLFAGLGP